VSVLRTTLRAAASFYDELPLYAVLGLGHVVGWFLILPGPFVLAGIYSIGQRAIRGQGSSWSTVWRGIKEYGPRSLLLFLTIVAGYGLVLSNLWFYNTPDVSPLPTSFGAWITPVILLVGLLWTGVAFYAQAFLMELKEPRLLEAIRNSLLLTLARPLQTMFFVSISLVLALVSVAIPLLLVLTPGCVSALSLAAIRSMVVEANDRGQVETGG
jgi:uncharacterized membrane protein YesL